MNEQTKTYRWLPWAVATGGVIALSIIVPAGGSMLKGSFSLYPWENAAGIETVRAINAFSEGVVDSAPYWKVRLGTLAGIIILFVLGPSLWIFSEIRNQSREVESEDDRLKKGLSWYAGVMIVIAGLIYAIPVMGVKAYVFNNTWESAAVSRNLDDLRSELMRRAFKASELYYLSLDNDGEGGFRAITGEGGEKRPLTIGDLGGNHSTDSGNHFVLAPVESDTAITIYGVGHEVGSNPDFENINGDRGKVQIGVRVIPMGRDIHDFVSANTNE